MGFIEKIKLLFKVKSPVENIIREVGKVKSGWKTSEFWLTVVSNLIAIAGALSGVLDAKTAAIVVGVLNAIYAALRTIAKSGEVTEVPKV